MKDSDNLSYIDWMPALSAYTRLDTENQMHDRKHYKTYLHEPD